MIRSRWRLFLSVFLVVFLGGVGVSGAAALWSQNGLIKAQITTGTWIDYSRKDFPMPLTGFSSDARFSGLGEHRIGVSWKNATASDPTTPQVAYQVDALGGDLRVRNRSLPQRVSATSVSFITTTPILWSDPEHIDIRITPYVNDVPGTPTTQRIWLDSRGSTWVTKVS